VHKTYLGRSNILNKLKNDFFLNAISNQVAENAQNLFFSVYFKMQKTVKIDRIADFLSSSKE
jgi:hypothetical protein